MESDIDLENVSKREQSKKRKRKNKDVESGVNLDTNMENVPKLKKSKKRKKVESDLDNDTNLDPKDNGMQLENDNFDMDGSNKELNLESTEAMNGQSAENLDLDREPKKSKKHKRKSKTIEGDLDIDMEQNETQTENNNVKVEKFDEDLDHEAVSKDKSSKPKCVKCNKEKKIHCRSMCRPCYDKDLRAKRKQEGRNSRKLITCVKCNQTKKHSGRGLCRSCWESVKKAGQLDQYAKTRGTSNNGKKDTCISCQKIETIYLRSLCRPCYQRDLKERRKARKKTCPNCKKLKQLQENGFCSRCNLNEDIEQNANEIDHELKLLLEDIEECPSIQSARLVVCVDSLEMAKQFEQHSKIKIEFVEKPAIDSKVKKEKSLTSAKTKAPPKPKAMPTKAESMKAPPKPKKVKRKKKECKDCNETKLIKKYGRCSPCYKSYRKRTIRAMIVEELKKDYLPEETDQEIIIVEEMNQEDTFAL